MIKRYHLIKHFWIACAHRVPNAGKCDRVHGHNYKVTFCIVGSHLDEKGMLMDFRDVKHAIEDKYDHHFLNEFPEFNNELGGISPSTERVAEVFYYIIKELCSVKENHPVVKWVEVQETNEALVKYEELDN